MTCLIVDDDPIARAVVERFAQQHDGLTPVGVCSDAVDAANRLAAARKSSQPIELVFLDVEMPEMTGLELAEALGAGPDRPQIVLITSKEEYAREAFDVEATDYIVKPVTYGRFVRAVERALARKAPAPSSPEPAPAAGDPHSLFIKEEGRLVRLDLREVLYVEARKDYALFHTASGEHMAHTTMKALEARLPADFLRIHRSYLIRIDRIQDIEDRSVVVGQKVLPVGATYRSALLDKLNAL